MFLYFYVDDPGAKSKAGIGFKQKTKRYNSCFGKCF